MVIDIVGLCVLRYATHKLDYSWALGVLAGQSHGGTSQCSVLVPAIDMQAGHSWFTIEKFLVEARRL